MKIGHQLAILLIFLSRLAVCQEGSVHGVVKILAPKEAASSSEVVVWLTNLVEKEPAPPGPMVRLLQKDKRFTPHILVVTVGTPVEFPNQDPYFHDVFSIYHGKPFDLGLYESGAVRRVRFSEVGVSYIFCNIHPAMSAVVVALTTPHFATSASDGSFQMLHIPPGRYKMEVWSEHASQDELAAAAHEVNINGGDNVLPSITLHSIESSKAHLNKYGETYSRDKTSTY